MSHHYAFVAESADPLEVKSEVVELIVILDEGIFVIKLTRNVLHDYKG